MALGRFNSAKKKSKKRALHTLQRALNSFGFGVTIICPRCSQPGKPVEITIYHYEDKCVCPQCDKTYTFVKQRTKRTGVQDG